MTNAYQNSSAHWLGNRDAELVQRIAGIAFPNNKLLQEYKTFLIEAAKRNHRKIGTDQKLFFFDDVSPGSCFFLPHGARIYNAMLELLKSEYRKRGYDEVVSPNIYKSDLWKTSGHWDHYEENMFTFDVEKERFGLKPMNCPGHCKIFGHSDKSYRDLPLRMADFGVLHRNEFSGALSGLTRVRRFQQDDAHIFCTFDQVSSRHLRAISPDLMFCRLKKRCGASLTSYKPFTISSDSVTSLSFQRGRKSTWARLRRGTKRKQS